MTIINDLRGPKLFDMAVFDWVATIIGAMLISIFLQKKYKISYDTFPIILLIAIIVGIISHMIFGINTKFNYYLCLSNNPRPN